MASLDAYAMVGRLQSFAQKKGVQLQPVSVNELVSSLKPSWQRTVPNLSLLLGAVPVPADADPYQLTRALLILLQHAHRSRKPGAGMVVETSCADLAGMGSWIRIRVAYASFGENAALLERAFEPAWTDSEEGLPACYALVREMEGFLTVGLEQGMTVAWEIYLRQNAEAAEGVRLAPGAPTVVLVEPNPRVGLVLQQHFEQHEVRLICAATCREARLAAEIQEAGVAMWIANVPEADPSRQELAGIDVHWLPGYRHPATGDLLTKGQVLQQIQRVLEPATRALAAGQGS